MKNTELSEAINQQRWKATDHVEPHEYILESWNPVLYHAILDKIRKEGYNGGFQKWKYRYVDIDEHRYWHIGTVLNRTRNDVPSKYFWREK